MAPVLEQGAVTRDIYLPNADGIWLDENRPENTYIGPIWLKDYSADLSVLPHFKLFRDKHFIGDT